LLKDWPGEAVRLAMLQTHYRQPIDWTAAKSTEAEDELFAWAAMLIGTNAERDGYSRAVRKELPKPSPNLIEALLDDLNTPAAITALRENYKLAHEGGDKEKSQFLMDCQFLGVLRHNKLWVHLQGVMGRNTRGLPIPHKEVRTLRIAIANNLPDLRRDVEAKLAAIGLGAEVAADGNVTLVPISQAAKDLKERVEGLVAERNNARKSKNFKEADRIRDELKAMGVELEDHEDGSSTLKVMR